MIVEETALPMLGCRQMTWEVSCMLERVVKARIFRTSGCTVFQSRTDHCSERDTLPFNGTPEPP